MSRDHLKIYSLNTGRSIQEPNERLLDEQRVTVAASGILMTVRELLKMRKKEAARVSGISHVRYHLLEKGKAAPSSDEWLRICAALEIPLSSLEQGFLFLADVSQLLQKRKAKAHWMKGEPGVYRPRGNYNFLRREGLPLSRGDLSFAQFVLSEIPFSDFSGANLRNTNFAWGNLKGARLKGANLYNAQLGGAILIGADLRAADLSGAKLMLASYDISTKLPFSDREAFLRGMIKVNLEEKAIFETDFSAPVVQLNQYRDSQTQ